MADDDDSDDDNEIGSDGDSDCADNKQALILSDVIIVIIFAVSRSFLIMNIYDDLTQIPSIPLAGLLPGLIYYCQAC